MGHPTDLDERLAARDDAEAHARDPRRRLDYTELLEQQLEMARDELERIRELADEAKRKWASVSAYDLHKSVRVVLEEMARIE